MAGAVRVFAVPAWVRRWVIGGGVLLVAFACAAVLWAVALVQEAPTWWRTISATDPAVVSHAEQLERSATDQVFKDREASTPWRVSLTSSDANAWLNARLPKWLANQNESFAWPDEVSQLQVEFRNERIEVGMLVESSGGNHVLSATLVPKLDETGSLWMVASWVRVGRLPMPPKWVLSTANKRKKDYMPEEILEMPETRQLFDALIAGKPLVNESVFQIDEGRRIRLLSMSAQDGKLEITCRTESHDGS